MPEFFDSILEFFDSILGFFDSILDKKKPSIVAQSTETGWIM